MSKSKLKIFVVVLISILMLTSSVSAMSDAIYSAEDKAAALQLLSEIAVDAASKVLNIGIGAGIANATQPEDAFESILEDDDVVFLQDMEISFNDGTGYADYSVTDIMSFGADSPSIESSLSTDGVDKGYGSDVVMEVGIDSIYYYYRFDDPINISKASMEYPLELDMLGHHIKITSIGYDELGNANQVTLKLGRNFFITVGQSVKVEGHTVKLEEVVNGTIAVSVDGGEIIAIDEDSTRAWEEGIEVTADNLFYKEGTPLNSSANLVISKTTASTYQDEDPFIGEPEDDEQWRWEIGNLAQNAVTVVTSAGVATGPILGLKNYFVADDSGDDDPTPISMGGCYPLTQDSGAQLCIRGLTTGSYIPVYVDFANVDLRDAGGNYADMTSVPVLRLSVGGEPTYNIVRGSDISTGTHDIKLLEIIPAANATDVGKARISVDGVEGIIAEGDSGEIGGVHIEVTSVTFDPVSFSCCSATIILGAGSGFSGARALKLNRNDLMGDTGYLTSDIETDTIYIYKNATAGFNHPILEVFYIDEDNDVAIAGNITSDGAGAGVEVINGSFAYVDYENTKGEDIRFWMTMDKVNDFFYLNITSNRAKLPGTGGAKDDLSINLQNSTANEWDRIGNTASAEEVTDMWYENALYASGIGDTDADLRTEYGIIVKNPKENFADDKAELLMPGGPVRAKVAIMSQGKLLKSDVRVGLPVIESVKLVAEVLTVIDIREDSVIVGGPAANNWTAYFMDVKYPTYGTELGWTDGWCHIKEYTKDQKTVTVVAGWDTEDTVKCMNMFLTGSTDYNIVMPTA